MSSWRFSNFYFFYFTTIGVIVPYWSVYLQYLGFNAAQIGELVAILVATKLVGPNIIAGFADRISLRHGHSLGVLRLATGATFAIFCLMYAIEPSISGEASQYSLVALITFGFSLFWNACVPQMEAATLNHLAHERYKYGSIRLWGSVGFIVAVVSLSYLIEFMGPSVILPFAVACIFAMFVSSFGLIARPLNKKTDIAIVPLRSLLNRKVVIILLLCSLMQISHAPFYTFFSIYLEGYDYDKSAIGWLWSLGVAVEVLVFLLGYKFLRHYRLTSLLSFTFLVAAIRWCLLAKFPENLVVLAATQIMHAVTYGLYHSVMIQLVDQFFKGRYQIRGQALYVAISFGVGGSIGSALSGYIWSSFGANSLFMWAGVLMFIATLLSWGLVHSREESLPIREL